MTTKKTTTDTKTAGHAHECVACGVSTYLKGWLFIKNEGRRRYEKKYKWFCKQHYIAYMFGLVPFICVCKSKNLSNCVWISFENSISLSKGNFKEASIKCPYCKKKMKKYDLKQ